jgi:hypothetical protein
VGFLGASRQVPPVDGSARHWKWGETAVGGGREGTGGWSYIGLHEAERLLGEGWEEEGEEEREMKRRRGK